MKKEEALKQLDEIQVQIAALQRKEEHLKKTIAESEKAEVKKQYVEEVFLVSEDNSSRVQLYSDTKTTPIMDKFYFSEKRYLIFNNMYSMKNANGKWIRISLVIRKGVPQAGVIDNGLTMTDLKKTSGMYITSNPYRENSRHYALFQELMIAASKFCGESKAIPFGNPIRLGGQTFADQSGYGSKYYGDIMVEQGTLYGETTGFSIIGVLVSNSLY